MNKKTIKSAFITSLPVLAGYIVLGTGFGVLLSAKGYSVWWAILMCVVMFAGSGQYVGVGILASGASVISAALITLMVNARHIFYGVSMIENYRSMGWRKWYAAFGLTDETYSLLCMNPELPEGVDRRNFNFLVTLMNHIYWICGGLIGAVIGSTIPFNSAGIDFSMTALFVIIFVEQWEKTKQHLPAIWGFVVSLICLFIFGSDNFLIPSMIGISTGLFLMHGKLESNINSHKAKEDKHD